MRSLYYFLVAQLYDRAMRKVERLCLHRWRRELLSDLHGVVLEIGAGTGINLQYYPPSISQLLLCEPDPAMRRHLERRVQKSPRNLAQIRPCAAELLDVADNSLDHLVSTLVLCSVSDPQQALREAFRVLKPGGKLLLMEHVAADKNGRLYFWQQLWQPVWKRCACNCHLTRQTGQLLEDAGFKLYLREEVMCGAPAIVTPMLVGHALRP